MCLYEKLAPPQKNQRLKDKDGEKLLALIKETKDKFPDFVNDFYNKSMRKGQTCSRKTHFIKK